LVKDITGGQAKGFGKSKILLKVNSAAGGKTIAAFLKKY
jgi:hypothetical protein